MKLDRYVGRTVTGLVPCFRGTLLGATLLGLVGCAGMEPDQYRNHREEGPTGGVFSGPSGEFAIFRKSEPIPGDHDDSEQNPDRKPKEP